MVALLVNGLAFAAVPSRQRANHQLQPGPRADAWPPPRTARSPSSPSADALPSMRCVDVCSFAFAACVCRSALRSRRHRALPSPQPSIGLRAALCGRTAEALPAVRKAREVVVVPRGCGPLSGETLAAALKIHCELSGAAYSIFWTGVDGEFVVGGFYAANADDDSFPHRCQNMRLGADSIVSQVAASGEATLVEDVGRCAVFHRADLAKEFGIKSVFLVPEAGGVVEYGSGAPFTEKPSFPSLPKPELAKAFANFGASYVMYWSPKGDGWAVAADYATPASSSAQGLKRGDGDTFCGKCRQLTLDSGSEIARVASAGFPEKFVDVRSESSFSRSMLAEEFGVTKVKLVPYNGGVIEYGVAPTKATASIEILGVGVFAAILFLGYVYSSRGLVDATTWLSCYVLEYSLSVDNIFVFIQIFKFFKVPQPLQSLVLNYGIFGAIAFRFIFIYLGAIVLQQFSFLILFFAAILIYACYTGLTSDDDDEDEDLADNFIIKNLQKVLDVTPKFDGAKFITTVDGRTMVTPLLLCLLTIEFSDIVFATDSVPAVLGTTQDSFIAYSSNIFAIYGLRSLFLLLNDAMASFTYLEKAVNFVLGFIGVKIILDYFEIVKVDVVVSLATVVGALVAGVVLSVMDESPAAEGEDADDG